MEAIDVSGFVVIKDRIYPAAEITLRTETTHGFSSLSLSCGDTTMLQIPVTDSVKKMLKEVM